MTERVSVGNLRVARVLYDFITNEALPGTGIDAAAFWSGLPRWSPTSRRRTRAARRRDALQAQIDAWHRRAPGADRRGARTRPSCARSATWCPCRPASPSRPRTSTPRSPRIAGPQLVVPVINARYALNAANARWGTLYDALYGTDALPEARRDARPRLQPGARRQGDRMRAPLPRPRRAAGARLHVDATAYCRATAASCCRRSPTARGPAGRPGTARRLSRATRRRRLRCCCATTACTSTSASTAAPDRRGPTRPASPTSCSKSALSPSST